MKKILVQIVNIILIAVLMLTLAGCNKSNTPEIEYYQVSLIDGEDTLTNSYEINTPINLPTYEKVGYIFEGWYKDINKTDGPYTTFQASTKIQVSFYAKWISIDEIDQAAAQPVIDAIDALPSPITLDDEEDINNIVASFTALSDNAKTKVTNIATLNEAIETIILLKLTEEESKLIKPVIDIINALPTSITLNDEQAVNEASQAFASLDEKLQEKVFNVAVLQHAVQEIDAQRGAVNAVINAILALNQDITLDDKQDINNARALYDDLTSVSKTYITNYESLLNIETKLQELLNEIIDEVTLGISILPSIITYNDKTKVDELVRKYEMLTAEQKASVLNYDTLEAAVQVLRSIEENTTQITYCLGDNVYESKTALFESFFTDFYYFILSQNGASHLRNNNIKTLDDFLNLASDMNGGGTTQMRGIGNIAGGYLLSRDLNGIAFDQPTNKFIGFCVKNGLYEDLIPFFIRFFAYWRIDEHYASLDNYGADFFAESWAPTVDIGKFFYYTEETSYVKSDRMIDCFVNIAGVVYGDLPKYVTGSTLILPTNIKLRGYKFMGWYNNPNFSGEPILTISENHGKVILYAKWEIDQAQKNKDDAELVDVYIYNLMPTPANPTKANVQKIRDMYNALSADARTLVTRYNTLVEYENKFQSELTSPLTINIIINKPSVFNSFDEMKTEFLSDFNQVTNSTYVYSDFTNSRYSVMRKLTTFFANDEMYTKWSFILTYMINANSAARGLVIQTNRALNRQTGDLEYLSKAIDGFFNGSNLTSDSEVGVNFTNSNEVITNDALQKQLTLSYTTEANLPALVINGYRFIGYATNESGTGDIYHQVTDTTPTQLFAMFE